MSGTVDGPVDLDIDFPGAHLGPAGDGIGHFVDAAAFRRYARAYRAAAARLPAGTARTFPTSRGEVRGYRWGPEAGGPPLLLLSGRNAASPSWAPALPALLSSGRPVHAVDSPGEAGCSSQSAPLQTPDDQAAWVVETVAALGEGPVHLVGHSLGGWVAAQVAARRPDVLASVTVLDPPATFARVGVGFVAAGLAAAVLPAPRTTRERLLGWIAGGSHGAAPVAGAAALAELGLAGLEGFRVRQRPPSRPRSEDLRLPGVPALAVLGGRSRVHDAQAAAHAARAAGWRTASWSDAGHTLHVDFPRRLAALLEEQLALADRG